MHESEPYGLFIFVTAQLNLNLNMSWELHVNGYEPTSPQDKL